MAKKSKRFKQALEKQNGEESVSLEEAVEHLTGRPRVRQRAVVGFDRGAEVCGERAEFVVADLVATEHATQRSQPRSSLQDAPRVRRSEEPTSLAFALALDYVGARVVLKALGKAPATQEVSAGHTYACL